MNVLHCDQYRYVVTDEDRLWLLRAVQVEGPVQAQVAQVLCNCFAYLYARDNDTWSLTKLVRSYAQPVNPAWFRSGLQFQKWHARDPVKYPLSAALRRETMHSVRTTFDPPVVAAVDKALTAGPVDIPKNATDYAAAWIDASHKYTALTGPQKGRNRLWTRAPEWAGYRVSSSTPVRG
jgi:hypothetical protein